MERNTRLLHLFFLIKSLQTYPNLSRNSILGWRENSGCSGASGDNDDGDGNDIDYGGVDRGSGCDGD